MPAILDGDEAIEKWLDFAEVPTREAMKLIRPAENIAFHPVSTFVNSVRNDTPECLVPIELGVPKVSTWLWHTHPLRLCSVSPGGQSYCKQQGDAGLAEELPGGLSPEERRHFAQVEEPVHPQPFAQEEQCRHPAAVAGAGGGAACQEAKGIGQPDPACLQSSLSTVQNARWRALQTLMGFSKPLRCCSDVLGMSSLFACC